METALILVLLIIFIAYAVFLNKKLSSNSQNKELMEIVKLLKESSSEDRRILLNSLHSNTSSLNQRLEETARVISDVQKNVGEMSEIGRSMKSLQEFLQSPKLRGNIGEQVLSQLLKEFLPQSSFHLQYSYKNGEKVDAAIKTEAGIIPVDSKFPMENFRKMIDAQNSEKSLFKSDFRRDVKKHIKDISSKYIVTDEGTIDYALMYIPSEAVYYEIVNDHELFEYANKSKILPVSPSTFYAYMRAILMSFEGQKIEKQAKVLLSSLKAIRRDYENVEDNLSVLSKHLGNANNMYKNVLESFTQLGEKISNTTKLGDGLD